MLYVQYPGQSPDLRQWEHTTPSAELAAHFELIPIIPALRPQSRQPWRKNKAASPFPVYVATLPDGTHSRLSFYQQSGKTLDFSRGYNVTALIHRQLPIAGYVSFQGQRYPDPFFTGAEDQPAVKQRKPSTAKLLRALAAAVMDGDETAALAMAKAHLHGIPTAKPDAPKPKQPVVKPRVSVRAAV